MGAPLHVADVAGDSDHLVLCFVVCVVIIIWGWPLTVFLDADTALEAVNVFAFSYLGLMVLSIVGAFAHDVQLHENGGLSYGKIIAW